MLKFRSISSKEIVCKDLLFVKLVSISLPRDTRDMPSRSSIETNTPLVYQ